MKDATSYYIKMKIAIVILLSAFSGILANERETRISNIISKPIGALLGTECKGCNLYCPKPAPEGCCERLAHMDAVLTTSSDWNADYGPHRSGLFTTVATGPVTAWCARTNDGNQWIQADFGSPRQVTGVLLQGRGDCCDQWVTSFRVLFSDDGEIWYSTEPIVGTFDRDTVQRRYFDQPINARYLRVNPIAWNNHISLRFDLIGCN